MKTDEKQFTLLDQCFDELDDGELMAGLSPVVKGNCAIERLICDDESSKVE